MIGQKSQYCTCKTSFIVAPQKHNVYQTSILTSNITYKTLTSCVKSHHNIFCPLSDNDISLSSTENMIRTKSKTLQQSELMRESFKNLSYAFVTNKQLVQILSVCNLSVVCFDRIKIRPVKRSDNIYNCEFDNGLLFRSSGAAIRKQTRSVKFLLILRLRKVYWFKNTMETKDSSISLLPC